MATITNNTKKREKYDKNTVNKRKEDNKIIRYIKYFKKQSLLSMPFEIFMS